MDNASFIPKPGVRYGDYPERKHGQKVWAFFPAQVVRTLVSQRVAPGKGKRERFLASVHRHREALKSGNLDAWLGMIRQIQSKLNSHGLRQDLTEQIFALLDAVLHHHLKLRLHDSQFIAAWYLLDRRLVEMQTGEGKTLAVSLAAMTAALAGVPVHVITANDYLVKRDADALQPLLAMLGLTVGAVTSETATDERASIYMANITYCTASELVFDYLRDHLAATRMGLASQSAQRSLRGLCMAIIDEADNILIDDARTPMILSESAAKEGHAILCRQMLYIASQLEEGRDYVLNHRAHMASLTPEGIDAVELLWQQMGGDPTAPRARRESLCSALAAVHLFERDKHYLVVDGKVAIVDASTGRIANGRVWAQGLHQMIETKEGCAITHGQATVAQMTFQRFFRRYIWLAGISGTLSEARHELAAIYALPVLSVNLQFESRRRTLPSRVFGGKEGQFRYVAERVRLLQQEGRPVLVATEGVMDSHDLSERLREIGVEHEVLNAATNASEDRIVADAGKKGAVTISTNIAGRGTDIRLAENTRHIGGLHVIACQSNDSRRIDQQLYGRCARQGEPGSAEHLYRLDQPHCQLSKTATQLAMRVLPGFGLEKEMPRAFLWVARVAQWRRARLLQKQRWNLLLQSLQFESHLAFTGESE